MKTLLVTAHTWLKLSPRQSSELSDDAKFQAKPGDSFPIQNHEPIEALEGEDTDQHIQFSLVAPINNKLTWFAYQRHVSILEGDTLLYPRPEEDTTQRPAGKQIKLPSGKVVYSQEPIISGGNFTWGEATHGGTRIPDSTRIENNMIALAKQLQRVRDQFGPIRVTSWYRPPAINARVGGARRSQHLNGSAVDITIQGRSGRQIAQAVISWWPGGLGIYPGDRKHILHLDVGPKRSWGI